MNKRDFAGVAAVILGFAGSAGYLLRFIFHFTSYVIKIQYTEAVLYGLIPCLLIAAYSVFLILRRPVLCGAGACAVIFFSLGVSTFADAGEFDAASVIVIVMGVALSVIYLLTFMSVIKSYVPVIAVAVLSTAVYILMTFISFYVYLSSGDPAGTYYGILGSVVGLTLFYMSVLMSAFSFRREKLPVAGNIQDEAE